MGLLLNKNFAYSVLAAQALIGDSTMTVATGTGTLFPTKNFVAVLWTGTSPLSDATREIVLCTTRSTDTLTVTRAQESTSAKQWEIGTYIACVTTAGKMDELEGQIALLGSPENFALNGSFENWAIAATGPDNWNVSNLVASITTSLSERLRGCQLTALLSTVGRFYQTMSTDMHGIRGTYNWTFNLDISCSAASRVRVYISYPDGGGGTVYTYSDYHTGGGTTETLSVTKSILTSSATIGIPSFGVEITSGAVINITIDSAMFTVGKTPRLFVPSVLDHHGKFNATYPLHFEMATIIIPTGYLDLPSATNLGFAYITTNENGTNVIHHTLFSYIANATIVPLISTSRFSFTDTSGYLSVFDNGTQVRIKNNMTANAYVIIKGWYW